MTSTRHPALDSWGDYDRDDPFPLFAQVRSAAPVHEVRLADGHPAWLVVGHEEAKAALNDPRLSKDMHAALARSGEVVAEGLPGPALARHMLSVDPPDHTRLRRLAMPAFSRRRVDGLEARVRSIVDALLDDLEARGGADRPVDLVAGYAFPLPFTVISELLGIPEPDRADLGRWFRILLAPSSGPQPPAEAVAASGMIVEYLTALLDRKRAAPGEDLVTDLVVAADRDGALTEQEMLSTIFQLVVAGHDTTTSLIGNGTVALLRHPAQRDALVADPGLVPRAIEECLRWDAPVPHSTFRYTTEEIRIGPVDTPSSSPPSPRSSSRSRRRTGIPPATATRSRSTSTGPTAATSPSATASTSASARRWPGWRRASPSPRCTPDSPRCALASRPPNSTGATATGWCYAGSANSPSSSDRRRCRRRHPRSGHDREPCPLSQRVMRPSGAVCLISAGQGVDG